MYDEQYNISNDKEFINILNNSELSIYTQGTYQLTLNQFCKCIGKTYSEFVEEIKKTQGDDIDFENKKVYRYNPNNSLINDYIQQYTFYLKGIGNKESTIVSKLKQLLTLFRKSNLEVPKLNFKRDNTQKKKQLISTDDIRYVLDNSNIHHQALISFIASTGIRRYDVVNFKIEDFIEACSDYTDAVFLDDFLRDAPQNMVPYFEFIPHKTRKTGLPCKVCCSSESSNLILRSLRARIKTIERHNKIHNTDLQLTEEDALFGSKRYTYIKKLDEKSVTVIFSLKNKMLQKHKKQILDAKLRNREISKKEYKTSLENMPRFFPHALRHRFITTVRQYTTNRDVSLLLEGHASSIATDKFYVGESDELFNKRNIIETYLQVMPHLILFEKIDPLEYKSLVEQKRKNEALENELSSLRKKISKFDEINKYLKLNNVLEEIE